jgi:hypothetical protein
LDERQLEVWRALRARAKPKFLFHDWYVGAIGAVVSPDELNPDRLAHAGNSLREILEKIPRALETEVSGPDRNILEQSRNSMATAIARAKADYKDGWTGEITATLTAALKEVDRYAELGGSPTRAQRTFAGLAKLDPMIQALPGQSQQRKLGLYNNLAKKLERFTHHQCQPNDKEFRDCLTQAEDLILDLLAPITAGDQDELFAIISKGASVTDEEVRRALRLIERRGANFAFFFDNLHDPVWLKPLDAAGYFKDPPTIAPAGEGFVSFPLWWPMVFLRRVVTQAPESVVEILLKVNQTDNPRVLDGIVEIAVDLPVDLAVRLEQMISDYIKHPYHV